jgi:hypothetical protein
MRTGAATSLSSPYTASPFNLQRIPADATDWVLLQLRSTDGVTVVMNQSLFVRNDGWLMDENGQTNLPVIGIPDGEYYVVIQHRNHLPIMSSGPIALVQNTTIQYDFTAGSEKYYLGRGCKNIDGLWSMVSGDCNQDGIINSHDYVLWYQAKRDGDSGYQATDLNGDGILDEQDYQQWKQNALAGMKGLLP